MLIQRRTRIGLGVISWGGATNAPVVGTRSLGPLGIPTAGRVAIPTPGSPSSGFAVHTGPAVTVPPALAAPVFSAPQTGATSSIAPTVTSAAAPAAAPSGGVQSGGAWSAPMFQAQAGPTDAGYSNVDPLNMPGRHKRQSGAPTWIPWAIIAALAFVVGKEMKR